MYPRKQCNATLKHSTFDPPPEAQVLTLREINLPLRRRLCKPTPPSNPLAIPDKNKRDDRHRNGKESQQGTRPVDPQPGIHRRGGQRQAHGEDGPQRTRGGGGGGGELLIRVGEVVEQRHEDEQVAEAEEDAGHHGHDGVDGEAGGPAEPEEGDGDGGRADAGEGEAAVFLDEGPGLAGEAGFGVVFGVEKEDGEGEDGAGEDCIR